MRSIDHGLDRLLLVVGLFNFFPGVHALRLLVRKVDVALFRLALVAHDVDFVAGLELRLALVIEHFRQRQHAFRLGADIHDHMSAGQLQNRALDDAVFTDRFFGLGGEGLQRGGEVLGWRRPCLPRRDAASALAARVRGSLICSGWCCCSVVRLGFGRNS